MPTITHIESEAKFRKRFGDQAVWHGDGWYDRTTGEKDMRPPKPLGVPYIISDIPAHTFAGKYVGGRADVRELEKTHGVIPYERTGDLATAPAGVYDPKCDKWKQWMRDQSSKVAKRSGLDEKSSAFEKSLREPMAEHKKKVLAKAKKS